MNQERYHWLTPWRFRYEKILQKATKMVPRPPKTGCTIPIHPDLTHKLNHMILQMFSDLSRSARS